MRLIDADDLIITILTHDLCDTEQIDKDILEAPTVEAIPIAWLEKEYLGVVRRAGCMTRAGVVQEVIDSWIKENTPSMTSRLYKRNVK